MNLMKPWVVHRVLLPSTKNILLLSLTPPKYMLQHTQTNTHTLSTVSVICVLGPGQGEPYEKAYIYCQAGRRQELISQSVCPSFTYSLAYVERTPL